MATTSHLGEEGKGKRGGRKSNKNGWCLVLTHEKALQFSSHNKGGVNISFVGTFNILALIIISLNLE